MLKWYIVYPDVEKVRYVIAIYRIEQEQRIREESNLVARTSSQKHQASKL
jgi:hypothetical protein